MFGPNKVSQSLIDAVTKVMEDKGVAETQQLDEASEKVPTPTGMRVYGSSYGNSAKARRDQTKSSVDTLKGPKAKEMKEEEELDEDIHSQIKKHLDAGHSVHSKAMGRVGPVTGVDGHRISFKSKIGRAHV